MKGNASVTNMDEILKILEEHGADMTAKRYEVGEEVELLQGKGLVVQLPGGSGGDLQDDGVWPKKGKVIEKGVVVPFNKVGVGWFGSDQRDDGVGLKVELDGGDIVCVPGAW